MNKLLIPSIMVAVVMIAGIFAFVPVDQASTVHEQLLPALAGATTVRIVEALDDSTGMSGNITIDRVAGEGPWKIKSLQICDWEISTSDSTWIFYSVETDTLGDNFSVSGSAPEPGQWGLNNQNHGAGTNGFFGVGDATDYSGSGVILNGRGHVIHAEISGSGIGFAGTNVEPGASGTCTDLLVAQAHRGSGGTGGEFNLWGDEDNNVILHAMRASSGDGGHAGDGDGAFLIAYISGVESASDISIIDELNP